MTDVVFVRHGVTLNSGCPCKVYQSDVNTLSWPCLYHPGAICWPFLGLYCDSIGNIACHRGRKNEAGGLTRLASRMLNWNEKYRFTLIYCYCSLCCFWNLSSRVIWYSFLGFYGNGIGNIAAGWRWKDKAVRFVSLDLQHEESTTITKMIQ